MKYRKWISLQKEQVYKTGLKYVAVYFLAAGILFLTGDHAFSQGVSINNTGAAADASAMLDVSSSTMGMLIPRMTKEERILIALSANGLIVYQTDSTTGLYVNIGTSTSPKWFVIGQDSNYNTSLGLNALSVNQANSIQAGYGNTAIGSYTLWSNTTGRGNTAMGADALAFNTNGTSNTGIGYAALEQNKTGSGNTAIGQDCLMINENGSYNTGVGRNTLQSTVAGNFNTAVGSEAMSTTEGNYLTAIGANTDFGSVGLENATAIGYEAIVDASNSMVFGNGNVERWGFGVNAASGHALEVGNNSGNGNGAYLTAGGTWTNASDRNKKENFTPINGEEILEKIGQLPISMWNYIGEDKNIKHIGPMAQDFNRIFEVGPDDKSISTIDPAGVALAAIKELSEEISVLKAENAQLKEELRQMQNTVSKKITQIDIILQKLQSPYRLAASQNCSK